MAGSSAFKGWVAAMARHWPYAVLLLFVGTYNYHYLPLGYAASMDEGYLQSLAMRIIDGEVPYKDFDFLRTPLSIYLQAGLLWLFGDAYTVLAGRIWCVGITLLTIIVSSDLYRRFTTPPELVMLLLTSYVVVSLFLDFPWYSYDALFLAAISVVLLFRKKWFWCGLAAGLAGMAKQNYFLLIPCLLMAGSTVWAFRRERLSFAPRNLMWLGIGAALPVLMYALYMSVHGHLWTLVRSVVLLPPQIGGVDIWFTLFQNNRQAFEFALPIVLGVVMIHYGLVRKGWLAALGLLLLVTFGSSILLEHADYVFFVVYLSYAVAVIATVEFRGPDDPESPTAEVSVAYPFAAVLILQYLSGYNYSGLFFAQMGAGVALPLAYVAWIRSSEQPRVQYLAATVMVCVMIIGLVHKSDYAYQDAHPDKLVAPFVAPKLQGLYSSPERVAQVGGIIDIVDTHSAPGDYIFVYPHYPGLYYATGRRNPTRIGWYYKLEFNDSMFVHAMQDLRQTMPKLILSDANPNPVLLNDLLTTHYRELSVIGNMHVYALPE